MVPPPVSLGVTALLDELLLEESKLESAMDAFTGRVRQDSSADNQQQSPAELEQESLTAEDRQQLFELNEEVDSCLASMQNWEEESRLRRAKLEEDLEKEYAQKYGLSCQLDSQTHAEGGGIIGEDEDLSRYLGGAGRRQHGQRERLDMHAQMATIPSAKAAERDETRQADAERLTKLRAEVEGMRQREALGLGPWDDMQPDDLDTLVGTAGLSAWCEEVDAVLEDPAFSTDLDDAHAHAQDNVNDAMHSRIEADISEMEKLLDECNAIFEAQKVNS